MEPRGRAHRRLRDGVGARRSTGTPPALSGIGRGCRGDRRSGASNGRGRRRIGLGELYVEDGKAHLTLAVDELVVAVHVPADAPPSSYRKVRTREAIDFPLAGVAVALEVAAGTLKKLRIAVTGTNSRPFLVEGTHALVGKRIDETLLQALDKLVQKQVQPMRTTIATAHYRRLAAAARARRLVAKLAAEQVPAP